MIIQKKLSFTEIKRVAELLGERLKTLNEKLPYSDREHIKDKHTRVLAIHAAMITISTTANASVNRETLDEWLSELNAARDSLMDWCKDLVTFKLSERDERRDDNDDEIPF